ncbi:uroporphyrinogen decarboxylase family protein [Chloroflexota bacterium]
MFSKELVWATFTGRTPPRPPFIPYVSTVAARLMQVPIQEMFTNATLLANSLHKCQELFGYDGVVNLFDTTLEAEACGCRLEWQQDCLPRVVSHVLADVDTKSPDISDLQRKGRLPVVIEAMKRLDLTIGRTVSLFAVVTGPVTLAKHLRGEQFWHDIASSESGAERALEIASQVVLEVVKIYCQLKIDVVLMADEDMPTLLPTHNRIVGALMRTIHNIVTFHEGHLILAVREVEQKNLSAVLQLEVDGFSLGNNLALPRVREAAISKEVMLAGSINSDSLVGPVEYLERSVVQLLSQSAASHFFITSDWEVPYATPASNIKRIMEIVTGQGI